MVGERVYSLVGEAVPHDDGAVLVTTQQIVASEAETKDLVVHVDDANAAELLGVPHAHRAVVAAAVELGVGGYECADLISVSGERADQLEGVGVPDANGGVARAAEEIVVGACESKDPVGVRAERSEAVHGERVPRMRANERMSYTLTLVSEPELKRRPRHMRRASTSSS